MASTKTIYLREPPFTQPIYTYQVEYRNKEDEEKRRKKMSKIEIETEQEMNGEYRLYQPKFDPEAEVSFEFEDKMVKCRNGLLFNPTLFVPSGVLSTTVYHEKIARVVYFLQNLPQEAVKFINYFQQHFTLEQINQMTMSNFIKLAVGQYGNALLVERAKMFFDHAEFSFCLDQMDDNDYLNFAIIWLEYLFTGGENTLLADTGSKVARFVSPLACQIHGQQLFFWIHLISPILANKYKRLIGQTCGRIDQCAQHATNHSTEKRTRRKNSNTELGGFRTNCLCVEVYHFQSGETFAIDFWQSFYLALQTYRASTESFFNREFGELGSEQSIEKAKEYFEKTIEKGEITDFSDLEERFRLESQNFFLQQIEEEGRSVRETGKSTSIYSMLEIGSLFRITQETLMICTGLWSIEKLRAEQKQVRKFVSNSSQINK